MKKIVFDDYFKDIFFKIPLFSDLTSLTRKQLIEKLDHSLFDVNIGDVIAEQGEACNKLYVLLEGELEVYIIDANGNEVLIEQIIAPRTFATPHLFKEDNRFPATFVATENSKLLTATKKSTFQLISEFPELLKQFLLVSGRCNMCTTMRLDVLSRKTIRERILVYLLNKIKNNSSTIIMSHTLTQLADYLNVTRPALSTEFNKLEKEGIIKRMPNGNIELKIDAIKKMV